MDAGPGVNAATPAIGPFRFGVPGGGRIVIRIAQLWLFDFPETNVAVDRSNFENALKL
jgi:hypothetical protein